MLKLQDRKAALIEEITKYHPNNIAKMPISEKVDGGLRIFAPVVDGHAYWSRVRMKKAKMPRLRALLKALQDLERK